jgi:hypothetical protein
MSEMSLDAMTKSPCAWMQTEQPPIVQRAWKPAYSIFSPSAIVGCISACLELLLPGGRLPTGPGIAESLTLAKEPQSFKRKIHPLASHPASSYRLWLMTDVTRLLNALEQGDPHAAGRLLPLIYDEFRSLTARRMAHEQLGRTLWPDAL